MPHRAEDAVAAAAASGESPLHGPSAVGLHDAKLAGWYREDGGELFRGMPIGADDVVVDVGCGAGVNAVFCARQRSARRPCAPVPRVLSPALQQLAQIVRQHVR